MKKNLMFSSNQKGNRSKDLYPEQTEVCTTDFSQLKKIFQKAANCAVVSGLFLGGRKKVN